MSTIELTQTDTARSYLTGATCQSFYTIPPTSGGVAVAMSAGGTPGTTIATATDAGSSPVTFATFATDAGVPSLTDWPTGTVDVQIEVTTANMNMVWDRTGVCRLNSALAPQQDLTSVSDVMPVSITLDTVGVVTGTSAAFAKATSPASTDRLGIACRAGSLSMSQSFSFKTSSLVIAPFGPDPRGAYLRRRYHTQLLAQ